MTEKILIQTLIEQIKVTSCKCGAKLKLDMVENYSHPGGYHLQGYDKPQWVYIHCDSCEYDHALWKLGVPWPKKGEEVSNELEI